MNKRKWHKLIGSEKWKINRKCTWEYSNIEIAIEPSVFWGIFIKPFSFFSPIHLLKSINFQFVKAALVLSYSKHFIQSNEL